MKEDGILTFLSALTKMTAKCFFLRSFDSFISLGVKPTFCNRVEQTFQVRRDITVGVSQIFHEDRKMKERGDVLLLWLSKYHLQKNSAL